MIGKLKGIVDAVAPDDALIDVNGVGYLVGMGAQSLARLSPGAEAEIHIETHVREDAIKLWGFLSEKDRAWFARLQIVQGVGAKAALAILDVLGASELESAAALGDASAFGRAKGVGPKLAARLATELKDKPPPMGRTFAGDFRPHALGEAGSIPAESGNNSAREDAVSALVNLGYGESDARRAAAAAARAAHDGAESGTLIRLALKELAR
tara:strand:+ start:5351 stop:5983 length:633 start_codon:yes stop_codon:yes gene_type:complete